MRRLAGKLWKASSSSTPSWSSKNVSPLVCLWGKSSEQVLSLGIYGRLGSKALVEHGGDQHRVQWCLLKLV